MESIFVVWFFWCVNPALFFQTRTSSCPSTSCKDHSIPGWLSGLACQESMDCGFVCIRTPSVPLVSNAFPHARITQSWLLWLCKFWNWEVWISSFLLLLWDCLPILGSLQFRMNFRINWSVSVMGGGAAGLSLDSLDLGRQCGGDRHLDSVSSQFPNTTVFPLN